MTNIEKVKEVIKEYYPHAEHGIFDCRNLVGDEMYTIFDEDRVQVDICYDYEYFEVFGLADWEFFEVEHYYNSLKLDEMMQDNDGY